MPHNPDIYLLYEYMQKIPFTFRVKVRLDAPVDADILNRTAQEAISRYPYFSVEIGLDGGGNYTLNHNSRPLVVMKEEDRFIVLGSEEVNRHLFVITYKDNTVWFSCSHSPCGATGAFFWIKTTLYLYMCEKYGPIDPPKDIKLPGSEVTEGELFFPDAASLPDDEPLSRYDGGDTNLHLGRMLKYLFNPFAKNNYYYEIEIPSKEFIAYSKKIDASPNTLITAIMYKAMARLFKEKEGTFLSGRIAADYRNDIGAAESYRDFVRFIHVKYEWSMKNEPIEKLNMRARGAVIKQNQQELAWERFRKLERVHAEIDAQPDLKSKKGHASKNSAFRSDPRDTYTVSYVGQVDLGGMEEHIKNIYTITDGDLMIEVNALQDKINLCYQLINKDPAPLQKFLEVLKEENIPYNVSEMKTRYLPKIEFPK